MPTPPKLGDREGDIGVVEILQEVEAEHPAQADGHVAVTGEVEVDLEGIGNGGQPIHERAIVFGVAGVDNGRYLGHLVGQKELFSQAHNKSPKAGGQVIHGHASGANFFFHRLIADDGAGDELGEETHIHKQIEEIPLEADPPPVEVDDIGEDLEGVETDPNWKGEIGVFQAQEGQGPAKEVEVFKDEEVADNDENGRHQDRLLGPGLPLEMDHGKAAEVGDQGNQGHEDHHLGFAPGVEKEGGHEEEGVLQGLGPDEDAEAGQGEEEKEEGLTAKYHSLVLQKKIID